MAVTLHPPINKQRGFGFLPVGWALVHYSTVYAGVGWPHVFAALTLKKGLLLLFVLTAPLGTRGGGYAWHVCTYTLVFGCALCSCEGTVVVLPGLSHTRRARTYVPLRKHATALAHGAFAPSVFLPSVQACGWLVLILVYSCG